MSAPEPEIRAVTSPLELGESPVWSVQESALYCCDIAGRALHRLDPATGEQRAWPMAGEPACCALLPDGALLLARRDGLWRFDPRTGQEAQLAPPPYDVEAQRFNDGRCDAQGRFWVGTLSDARRPEAALYRWADGALQRVADGITVSNGLAFSPDARTLYWADTTSHTVFACDYDLARGELGARRVFARFPLRGAGQPLAEYGGRPDGATVDAEGAYWVAMYEGARLLRLAPDGAVLEERRLPVRCPTMPCFGGPDLRTLYVTTARHGRPTAELQAEPLAGRVLALRVAVPGLPPAFAAAWAPSLCAADAGNSGVRPAKRRAETARNVPPCAPLNALIWGA